jgi:hypothetical protein
MKGPSLSLCVQICQTDEGVVDNHGPLNAVSALKFKLAPSNPGFYLDFICAC